MNTKQEAALRDAWEDQQNEIEVDRQHQITLDSGWTYGSGPFSRSATHECKEPQSSDFQDGQSASGCWTENGIHYEQIVGSSGIYLVETDVKTGEVIRDSRPWQMTV